jgi:hypothetical protein
MRCTVLGPWQRSHLELDKTRGGEEATRAGNLIFPEIAKI